MKLPKGQKARSDFPRFGLPQYTHRFPERPNDKTFIVSLINYKPVEFDFDQLLPEKVLQQSDFHCVTTWSYQGLQWGGILFRDFYTEHIEPLLASQQPPFATQHSVEGCIFTAQDGAQITMRLEDLLAENAMLADSLDGEPLTIKHGTPLRLIVPDHYGYKNIKHLKRIDFYQFLPVTKRGIDAFLEHPRARVKYEERGRWVPGIILRYLYRPLISGTVRDFRKALELKLERKQ